jgi:hypothetical protein
MSWFSVRHSMMYYTPYPDIEYTKSIEKLNRIIVISYYGRHTFIIT